VMGFAPPSAEPPTKRPILTLYKQARAHGVGVVMATQNPVDLDYKLMSNAGTWMIGRLQTERDKARIVEGLRSASGEVDVAAWDARIGALGKRQFLLKSAASAAPTLFTTRWAMSFLRGPLTRAELMRLDQSPATGSGASALGAAPPASAATSAAGTSAAGASAAGPELRGDESTVPPAVADGIPVRYLDPAAPWSAELGVDAGGRRLEPGIAARVRLLFDETKGDIRHEQEWEAVFFPLSATLEPDEARAVDYDRRDFREAPPNGAVYALPDVPLDRASFYKSAEAAIEDHIFRSETLELLRNEKLDLCSRPGETEDDFRARCLAAAEDAADNEAQKLRDRFATKLESARKRMADTERRARELDVDVGQRRQQELVAGAGEVLSMFLGGRRRVRSLSGAASRRSQTRRTEERLRSAEEKVADQQDAIAELEAELTEQLQEIWAKWKEVADQIEELEVGLERTDVSLDELVIFWAPVA